MCAIADLRPLKQRLREEIKAWRRTLHPARKSAMDKQIYRRVVHLREYQSCATLLTYVSLPTEVDTLRLIRRAWEDGKRVAVPRCVGERREMEFYYIQSMEDLEPRTFGVLEPILERCERCVPGADSLCIVPALAYDRQGHRLGYGAGYYDRFLSEYLGCKVGVIYARNLRERLWCGRFDVPVTLILTEHRLLFARVPGARRALWPTRKKV